MLTFAINQWKVCERVHRRVVFIISPSLSLSPRCQPPNGDWKQKARVLLRLSHGYIFSVVLMRFTQSIFLAVISGEMRVVSSLSHVRWL